MHAHLGLVSSSNQRFQELLTPAMRGFSTRPSHDERRVFVWFALVCLHARHRHRLALVWIGRFFGEPRLVLCPPQQEAIICREVLFHLLPGIIPCAPVNTSLDKTLN